MGNYLATAVSVSTVPDSSKYATAYKQLQDPWKSPNEHSEKLNMKMQWKILKPI
jgi:ABC-type transporter lipoprotein component MlaA